MKKVNNSQKNPMDYDEGENMSDQLDDCSVSEGLSDAELVRLYDNDNDSS